MDNGRNRGLKVAVVAALIISVIGVTVGFAAFSTALEINGSAKVVASKWEVKFANLSAVTKVGEPTIVTAPTLSDTSVKDFDVTFKVPGESVSYTWDVVNNGSYNATLTTFTGVPVPTCENSGTSNGTDDAENVCKHIKYTLTYADGNAIAVNDTLNAGQTKSLKLTLTYEEHNVSSELPQDAVSISNLGINMTYSQAS